MWQHPDDAQSLKVTGTLTILRPLPAWNRHSFKALIAADGRMREIAEQFGFSVKTIETEYQAKAERAERGRVKRFCRERDWA